MTHNSHPYGKWQPWLPNEVAQLFSPGMVPWWIAGGWAIDLFLGEQTRDHEDVDVLFLRRDQQKIRKLLQGWDVQEAHPTTLSESWPFQEWENGKLLPPEVHDIWCRPQKTAPWAFQLMVTDTQNDQWIFRRTAQIRGPLSTLGYVTDDGIPYLAPEIQLLYKAKSQRAKDEADFTRALPFLSQRSRQWLIQALTIVHPDHSWLRQLESDY